MRGVLTHQLTYSFLYPLCSLELITIQRAFLKTYLRLPAGPKFKPTLLGLQSPLPSGACFPCLTSAPTCPFTTKHFNQALTIVSSSRESSLIVSSTRTSPPTPYPAPYFFIVPNIIIYINLLFLTSILPIQNVSSMLIFFIAGSQTFAHWLAHDNKCLLSD